MSKAGDAARAVIGTASVVANAVTGTPNYEDQYRDAARVEANTRQENTRQELEKQTASDNEPKTFSWW